MPSKGPNVQFLGVILQCLCITASSQYFDPPGQSEQARDYLRFADVNRRCQSVLSSAKELTYDDNLPSRVKRELSFEKGDWHQDAGQAPLLPFDGGDAQRKAARWLPEPLSLATFEVTHVEDDDERRPRTAVNVSGVVILTVSRKSAGPEIGTYMSTVLPEFNISAGSTRLKIIFEGVYTERAKGRGDNYDGERVLCMLGSALLPKRSADADGIDPWDWAKNSGRAGFQPPVTADNNILLVLQYPKELTLTTRAVLGKMRSTSAAPEAAYFDTVQLVAGLISYRASEYDFRPEALPDGAGDALSSSAADDPVFNRSMEDVYNGSYPCLVLDRYGLGGQVSTVLPGWRTQCNSTTGTCGHGVGPFDLGSAADAEVLAGVGIMMQDLQCQARHKDGYAIFGTATVSAVIRALPPWQDWRTAAGRSGLSGETLSAEGVWNASTGQVCMAACRGSTAGKEACRFRVCLLFPTTMSITARDTMLGRITSVDAHAPLVSFRQHMSPPRLWGYFPDDGQPLLPYRYSYTKVKQAGELRRKSASSFDLRKFIARTLSLRYPKRDGTEDHRRILSSLADTLTLCFMAVPSLFRQERIEQPVLHLEVFFLEQLVDRYVSPRYRNASSAVPTEENGSEGHPLLINVSAGLTIFEERRVSSSVMSLEGVYNPEDGRMHLIGCRDVRLPAGRNSSRDLGLEEGMDCSIEVKVQYPPTTMHWFIMSTAKVQIASTRRAADPLHFDAVQLRALPVQYPQQMPGGFFRGVVNGVLCVALLSATIAATLSQLRYLNSHADVAPYISLVMLGVQALGYGMPLVTGVEAILARVTLRFSSDVTTMPPSSGGRTPYYMFDTGRLCQTIDQAAKVLALGAFWLTLRLGQEVRRSRARMLARSPLDPALVPSDAGKVFACSYGIHLALFMLILALNGKAVTVEQQVALMPDLFLLPQVIGNAVWRVNCRPLRGSFYVGVTAARLLPHVYDCVRTPAVVGAYYDGQQAFTNAANHGRFFPRAGDVVIPLAAVALALAVHAQQRWNYAIVNSMGMPEQKKRQHMF